MHCSLCDGSVSSFWKISTALSQKQDRKQDRK